MLEKIRTKKGQKGIMGDAFDMKKFKSIDNREAALGYARKFLEMMGQGSSRAAYLLSGKYVVKVALNEKGIGQNRAEVDVYTNPESQPVVAKVFDAHSQYLWVIAEVVRPIKATNEFESLSGVDWETFCEYVNKGIKGKHLDKGAPRFIRAVIQTALKNDLLKGDLAQQDFSHAASEDVLDHYGKTADGRIVLLDYGFTGEVWSSHYEAGQKAMQAKSAPADAKTNKPSSRDTEPEVTAKTAAAKRGPAPVSGTVRTKKDEPQTAAHPKPGAADAKTAAPPRKKAVGAAEEDPDKTRR